ncbi:MAG: hypothetical protein ABI859_00025 [Pseudomonadota bacterium]
METWVQVQAGTNRYVYMNIVERTAMVQVVTSAAMATALDRDGFIALDIHFDTGKTEILPESMSMVDDRGADAIARGPEGRRGGPY